MPYRVWVAAVCVVLVDVYEDDVSLANEPVELCLLSVMAWQIPDVWGNVVIGGNHKGPEYLAAQFIRFIPCANLDGDALEESREGNGCVVLNRGSPWSLAPQFSAPREHGEECEEYILCLHGVPLRPFYIVKPRLPGWMAVSGAHLDHPRIPRWERVGCW